MDLRLAKMSACLLSATGLLFAGCAGSPAMLELMGADEVAAAPVEIASPALAAFGSESEAPRTGIGASASTTSFNLGTWATRATTAMPPSGGTGSRTYSDLFDDGIGLTGSFILSRPPTGRISAGDSYTLLTVETAKYRGKISTVPTIEVGDLDMLGIYIETKSMFTPLGRVARPYTRFGVGLVSMGGVSITTDQPYSFYNSAIAAGAVGGVGIDVFLGVWCFADIGFQVITPPSQAGSGDVGKAEAMISVPMRIGIMLNF